MTTPGVESPAPLPPLLLLLLLLAFALAPVRLFELFEFDPQAAAASAVIATSSTTAIAGRVSLRGMFLEKAGVPNREA